MQQQLVTTLENSRNYTLAVLEAIPQNLLGFKPVESVWTFGELLNHIAYGIEWWNDNCIKKVETEWNPPADKKTKKEIEAQINKAYATVGKTVEKLELNDAVIDGFYSTMNHVTHHRAQAVIYLRCNEITPPEYNY
jgi:uncharacterized damage-inducible protein DinB